MSDTRYSRVFAPETTLDDDDNDPNLNNVDTNEQNLSAEEKTWKKRYGDLRSFASKKEKELNDKVNSLVEQVNNLSRNKFEFPKTEAEVNAWAAKYPDVAKIVKTIAMKEILEQRQDLDQKFARLDQERQQSAKEKAAAELDRLHPDFFPEIKDSQEFAEWLRVQDEETQDTLLKNETNARLAAGTIALFKQETGWKAAKKETKNNNNSRDNARNVRVPSDSRPAIARNAWSESKVESLSSAEYEKYSDEIDAAIASGEFIYDLTGGAR